MSDSQSVSVPSQGEESNNFYKVPKSKTSRRKVFPSPLGVKSPTIRIVFRQDPNRHPRVSVPSRGKESNNTITVCTVPLATLFPSPLGAKSPTICSLTTTMGYIVPRVSVPSRGKESNNLRRMSAEVEHVSSFRPLSGQRVQQSLLVCK